MTQTITAQHANATRHPIGRQAGRLRRVKGIAARWIKTGTTH